MVTADETDVRALARAVATSLVRAPVQEGERWLDAGYWLTPAIGLLLLLLFRRGGAVALE